MRSLALSRNHIRAAAVAALPLLLLIGGSVYLVRLAGGGSAAGSLGPPSLTAVASSAAPAPATAPATESSVAAPATPTRSGRTASPRRSPQGPPPPTRASVKVGGARLNGSIQNDSCAFFVNEQFAVPVRVVGVAVNKPGVMVVDPTACTNGYNPISRPLRNCAGATLAPGGPGCDTGVRLKAGDQSETGMVQLTLTVTCRSKATLPCSLLGNTYSPSSARPVEVTWTDPGHQVTAYAPEPQASDESTSAPS